MAAFACLGLRSRWTSEVERKLVMTRSGVERFLDAVAPWIHEEIYDAARPVAYARTTYLDTDRLEYFRSGRTGSFHRRLRIREYASAQDLAGAPALTGACFLELKENAGPLRHKVRFASTPDRIDQIVRSHGELEESTAELGLLARRLRADRPTPRVTTWYRRSSFADADCRVRITVDSGIELCGPVSPGAAGSLAEPPTVLGRVDGWIVELKHAGQPPEWLARAVSRLPPARGLSKFALGMRAMAAITTLPGGARRGARALVGG
ncbi:MAG: VTC domain-containing protein [Deltaproteobacteria bacterium]|nr:VTC domain-containing protein [Deltaproteobacteria bacterium]